VAGPSSTPVILAALAGNFMIAVTKFAAAAYTGSAAMFSEAIHSAVDTTNQILLLFGIRQARRPPTREHPFGHGLQLYFWTFVVAVMIFGLGAGVSILEGIEKIETPHPIENVRVNYIVLAIAMLFEGAVWIIALRAFRRATRGQGWVRAIRASKDPTLFTVLFEDTAAMLGLMVAIAGLALGEALDMPVFDGIASLIIGLILATTALMIAYECQSLLTGEAATEEVRLSIRAIAMAEPGILDPNEILTMHFGPDDVLVALSLHFDDALSAAQVQEAVSRIERRIKAAHPEVRRVFIEAQEPKPGETEDGEPTDGA